jgi:hypothetical protein
MLLFWSEEHAHNWCAQWGREPGGVLSLQQAWELAQAWYGPDRREADWRRKTLEEVEALFAELGLVGSFWELRG